MGAYTWLTEQEFDKYSEVSDIELNSIFQEARSLVKNIYISERSEIISKWFSNPEIVTRYSLYSRVEDGHMEVKCLNLRSTNKDYVANYLFGLINGYRKCVCDQLNEKKLP